MTLREAFVVLAPDPLEDPEAEARRREAIVIVYEALHACASNMGGDARFRQLAQEEASTTLLHLLAGGPRHADADRWKTDEQVRGYLYRALTNTVRNRLRRQKREVGSDLRHLAVPPAPAETDGAIGAGADGVAALLERIRRDVLPLAGPPRVQQSLLRALGDLVALASEKTKLETLIERELGRAPNGDEERDRIRNRLYQRHARARRKLLLAAKRALIEQRIAARLFVQLESFVAALARRKA